MTEINAVQQEAGVEKKIKRDRQELWDLMLREKALLYGIFTLSSGKQSSYYFDGRLITLNPHGAYLVGKIMFQILSECRIDAVGGPTIGADPIVTSIAIASHLEGEPISAFIVRSEPKGHGTQKQIEGALNKGARVAIVDDVITKGGSIEKAIEVVEAFGCKVIKVMAILDRQEGGSELIKNKGYDFSAVFSADSTG